MTTAEPTTEKGDDLVARMNRAIDALGERLEGLEAELAKARGLVVQGKNEIDTAIAALETDACWCSSKHRCYRCRALDTLRPTFERMVIFLAGSK